MSRVEEGFDRPCLAADGETLPRGGAGCFHIMSGFFGGGSHFELYQ